MSFKRLDQGDIVISSDSVTAPCWTGNVVNLTSFFTSSDQVAADEQYYFNIYQTSSLLSNAAVQFSIAYGDVDGKGTQLFNSTVSGNSPSSTIYKQYRTLINGTEESNLSFGGVTSDYIYVLAIERSRYKEKIFPGSLTLALSGSGRTLKLTDNSEYVTTETFGDLGREYEIISGSAGVRNTSVNANGFTQTSGSYGKFLPDAGLIVLNGLALDQPVVNGGLALNTGRNVNTFDNNINKFLNAMIGGGSFTLRSEETVASNYIFVRARNSEFNYSTNPSNITGSGELRHDVMVDNPQSYLTTVGLYNDNNDLLAVAKLSRPLIKDFTKESLIRIKLDY
jgi:hypothetical protein